ncbi:hypothetical protein EVAR_74318_1 [Eumeta japonica]|uniref:Uncharacterized protein n=1 Tax=Eumeta variegata TaxID=151549 RepID=A0A4C1SFL9_EUMVA|nr:hypothetical protein EVAR_74318_1 [Eumeta japonica]
MISSSANCIEEMGRLDQRNAKLGEYESDKQFSLLYFVQKSFLVLVLGILTTLRCAASEKRKVTITHHPMTHNSSRLVPKRDENRLKRSTSECRRIYGKFDDVG